VSRAVLLDALGTLVTFPPPAARLRELLASRHGLDISADVAGRAMKAEIAYYRAHHHVASDHASLDALRRDCAEVVAGFLGPQAPPAGKLVATLVDAIVFEAFAEVPAVLDELRGRGHMLAVVSNWDVSLHGVLRATGLASRIDVVVTSAELGVAKPDPRPFEAALELLGAEAAIALHAGDSVDEDVAGARVAGVAPVLVWRDRAVAAPSAPGAAVVADLTGLLDLVP